MFCRSYDPVRDAEDYQQEQEAQPHMYCETCGERIYISGAARTMLKSFILSMVCLCAKNAAICGLSNRRCAHVCDKGYR